MSCEAGLQVSNPRQLSVKKTVLKKSVPVRATQAGSFFIQIIP